MMMKKYFSATEFVFPEASKYQLLEISHEIIEEIEKFSERNKIVEVATRLKDRKPVYRCCERCLKAHLLNMLREGKIKVGVIKIVNLLFNCETGHDGYYIDNDKLEKCEII